MSVFLTCDFCSSKFEVKDSRADSARFCSRQYYYSHKSKNMSGEDAPGWMGGRKVSLFCERCRSEFVVWKSRLDRGVRFCSEDCKYSWLSEWQTGENHPRYNPDKVDRKSTEYRQWKISVMERDGYKCVECGSTDMLQVHHITPIEDGGPLTEVDNGETLCIDCHADKHPDYAKLIKSKR